MGRMARGRAAPLNNGYVRVMLCLLFKRIRRGRRRVMRKGIKRAACAAVALAAALTLAAGSPKSFMGGGRPL